jgi:hypothetical protein
MFRKNKNYFFKYRIWKIKKNEISSLKEKTHIKLKLFPCRFRVPREGYKTTREAQTRSSGPTPEGITGREGEGGEGV